MNYSPSSRDAIDEHCREVIRSCLNIVEQHGDTYVAIHKDDDIECIVLVSMIRSYPILSIIVADKLLLADINAEQMHSIANELNLVSVTGWHSVFLADDSMIYMYRQCLWLSMSLTYEDLLIEENCASARMTRSCALSQESMCLMPAISITALMVTRCSIQGSTSNIPRTVIASGG